MRNPLARDIAIVFAAKAILVAIAVLFVFGPHQRPKIDVGGVEARLIGTPDAPHHARNISQ